MNLFRSEEHARRWKQFNPDFEKGLKPISFWFGLFSEQYFRARSRPEFMSWLETEEGKQADARARGKFPH